MKKIIYSLLVVLMCTNLIAQYQRNNACSASGMVAPTENFNRNSAPQNEDSVTPYVLNAYFTMVKDDDNSLIFDFNSEMVTDAQVENKFLECVKILNLKFSPMNIYFKYTGFQIVKNSDLTHEYFTGTSMDWNSLTQYKKPDCMNFFFLDQSGSYGPVTEIGKSTGVYPVVDLNSDNGYFLAYDLVHSVGHNLSLYHTYETASHFPVNHPNYLLTQCEHVTRINDGSHPEYNADIAGDEIADTPAEPGEYSNYFQGCGPYIAGRAGNDCLGVPFEGIINGNYMSNNIWASCGWAFTPQQIARMRRYIKNTTTFEGSGGLNSFRNNLASLYEPFYQSIESGNTIASSEDQPDNGGAWVCRNQVVKLRFQPGIAYEFTDTNSGTVLQTAQQQFNYDDILNHSIGVKIHVFSEDTIKYTANISSVLPYSCGFEAYGTTDAPSGNVADGPTIVTQDRSITVYPNPAVNSITVSASKNLKSVEFFDMQGRVLAIVEGNEKTVVIDISGKKRGIYFLKVQSEDGMRIEKVMKQ